MRLTFVYNDALVSLQVADTTLVHQLTPLLRVEWRLDANASLAYLHNGRGLNPIVTLAAAGLNNDDVIQVQLIAPAAPSPAQPASSSSPLASTASLSSANARPQPRPSSSAAIASLTPANLPSVAASERANMLQMLRAQPALRAQLARSDPALLQALEGPPAEFEEFFRRRTEQIRIRQTAMADPFSLEAQQLIESEIQQANIAENYAAAYEHAPESFISVSMLYVPLRVNGHALKAFVDSGAQRTIMNKSCAERCGISRLIDTNFSGIAQGVGTAKIVGRVHSVQVQFGTYIFTSSFTILDQEGGVDFLFGLDQLRKHRAQIDLEKNCLRMGGHEVTFLPDSELPAESEHVNSPAASAASSSLAPPTASSSSSQPLVSPSSSSPLLQLPSPSVATAPTSSAASRASPLSTASSASSPPPSMTANAATLERSIAELMQLGFNRAEAQRALNLNAGDVQRAASFLFAQQYGQ